MSTETIISPWDDAVPRIIPRTDSDSRSDIYGSGHSDVTLARDPSDRGVDSLDRRSGEQNEEKKWPSLDKDGKDGDEKKPQQPVGFFHHSLKKVRSQAFLQWAKTSEQPLRV